MEHMQPHQNAIYDEYYVFFFSGSGGRCVEGGAESASDFERKSANQANELYGRRGERANRKFMHSSMIFHSGPYAVYSDCTNTC